VSRESRSIRETFSVDAVTADKVKKECSAPSSLVWQNFMSQPLGKNSDPNEQKAGKAPELVSAFSRRENYLIPVGNRTPDWLGYTVVTTPTTLCAWKWYVVKHNCVTEVYLMTI